MSSPVPRSGHRRSYELRKTPYRFRQIPVLQFTSRYSVLDAQCSMLDAHYSMLNARYSMLNARYSMLNADRLNVHPPSPISRPTPP
jgi:hypothetical protein